MVPVDFQVHKYPASFKFGKYIGKMKSSSTSPTKSKAKKSSSTTTMDVVGAGESRADIPGCVSLTASEIIVPTRVALQSE